MKLHYCDNSLCESLAVFRAPVSVNKPGDAKRWYCAACYEVYLVGRQHARKTLEPVTRELLDSLRDVLVWQATYERGECRRGDLEESLRDARKVIKKSEKQLK